MGSFLSRAKVWWGLHPSILVQHHWNKWNFFWTSKMGFRQHARNTCGWYYTKFLFEDVWISNPIKLAFWICYRVQLSVLGLHGSTVISRVLIAKESLRKSCIRCISHLAIPVFPDRLILSSETADLFSKAKNLLMNQRHSFQSKRKFIFYAALVGIKDDVMS